MQNYEHVEAHEHEWVAEELKRWIPKSYKKDFVDAVNNVTYPMSRPSGDDGKYFCFENIECVDVTLVPFLVAHYGHGRAVLRLLVQSSRLLDLSSCQFKIRIANASPPVLHFLDGEKVETRKIPIAGFINLSGYREYIVEMLNSTEAAAGYTNVNRFTPVVLPE